MGIISLNLILTTLNRNRLFSYETRAAPAPPSMFENNPNTWHVPNLLLRPLSERVTARNISTSSGSLKITTVKGLHLYTVFLHSKALKFNLQHFTFTHAYARQWGEAYIQPTG